MLMFLSSSLLTTCIHHLVQFLSCYLIIPFIWFCHICIYTHVLVWIYFTSLKSYTKLGLKLFLFTESHQYSAKHYLCLFSDLAIFLWWKSVNGTLFMGNTQQTIFCLVPKEIGSPVSVRDIHCVISLRFEFPLPSLLISHTSCCFSFSAYH